MELSQCKLTKSEWIGIEKPLSSSEILIMNIIKNGWHDPLYNINDTPTIASYIKIDYSDAVDYFIYDIYLRVSLEEYLDKYHHRIESPVKPGAYKMNRSDSIRFKNMDQGIKGNTTKLYDFFILKTLGKMLKYRKKGKQWFNDYYTLCKLRTSSSVLCNKMLTYYVNDILDTIYDISIIKEMVYNGFCIMEQNTVISKLSDVKLYKHQVDIFRTLQTDPVIPKLILYTSPTGTGKTLTPIGISEGKRVIFLCAARHVGMALASSCISSDKKIAFAFGCETENDIRLHYFSAKDFVKDTKSGKIRNVDNTNGTNVEIIISDIGSYVYAMDYMLRFNDKNDIVMYWDEPTITMDYGKHELHEKIHNVWVNNKIPCVILSSATLPKDNELHETFCDFNRKFEGAKLVTIRSDSDVKSIPIVGPDGMVYVPHYLFNDYADLRRSIQHCRDTPAIFPYLDLNEIITFIRTIYERFVSYIDEDACRVENIITSMDELSTITIKLYYMTIIEHIKPDRWPEIYEYLAKQRIGRYSSTLHLTTSDAHTLTDGPSIYIAKDVEKIANYFLMTASIPVSVLKTIMNNINVNNSISKQIRTIESKIEDKTMNDIVSGNENKLKNHRGDPEVTELRDKLNKLMAQLRTVKLPSIYIPNTYDHLSNHGYISNGNGIPFTSDVSDDITENIMLMDDIDNKWKLLLLMGIGVFTHFNNKKYMEIMKELATNEKLYMIIADQDFIYGTNYQFCHGFISKDLSDMTQEKIIQAIGRVGRNKVNHLYSIRFRDISAITKLFTHNTDKKESENMSRIFNSITM